MPGLSVTWEQGGQAEIISSDGQHAVVRSDVAKAPGTPAAAVTAEGVRYELKVRTCRRDETPAGYRVEGRLLNLSAPARERLLLALRS